MPNQKPEPMSGEEWLTLQRTASLFLARLAMVTEPPVRGMLVYVSNVLYTGANPVDKHSQN